MTPFNRTPRRQPAPPCDRYRGNAVCFSAVTVMIVGGGILSVAEISRVGLASPSDDCGSVTRISQSPVNVNDGGSFAKTFDNGQNRVTTQHSSKQVRQIHVFLVSLIFPSLRLRKRRRGQAGTTASANKLGPIRTRLQDLRPS